LSGTTPLNNQPNIALSARIVLIEDDPFLRDLLIHALGLSQLTVCAAVGTGFEGVEAVRLHRPDVVLLDFHLPDTKGLRVLEEIIAEQPELIVLVMSGDEAMDTQLSVARAGGKGFLRKSEAFTSTNTAIAAVLRGEPWFSPQVLARVLSDYPALVRRCEQEDKPINQLSDREREVLILVARGLTNQQIARELFLSVSTVKAHIQGVFQKLNLPNRTEAAVFAVREGLLDRSGP
jgi:DNA-binding NarL/FixJ family response regulator